MALLVLLATIGLGPEEPRSLGPTPAPPAFDAGVGDAVALPPGQVAAVGQAAVAPRGAEPTSSVASRPSEGDSPEAAPAVAPGRAVAVAEGPSSPAPESGTGTEVPSDGATAVEAPPEGTSVPVAAPPSADPGGGPGRPIPSGGPIIESCDGDEYVITIVIDPEAPEGEEAQVEIVLKRFNADGTVDELALEGDVLDAQNLALQLSSEGNCVSLEAGTATEGGVPSDGTSQVVVPTEGTPPSGAEPDSVEPAAPDSP